MTRLFPHTCDVKRSVPKGENGRRVKETVSTGLNCIVVPMAARTEIENGFSVGSGADIYFPEPATDVKAGDQLVWHDTTYNVRAVAAYDVPRVGHLHALATREGA